MSALLEWLPLLNLLIIPVWVAYTKNEIRLALLEDHKHRIDKHLGWYEADKKYHGKS